MADATPPSIATELAAPCIAPTAPPPAPALQSATPFHTLVVDANAIITAGSTSLVGLAGRYVTVSEVLAEVRDARARAALASMPVNLEQRLPSDEALAAVRAFARLTGDLARLSRTDLAVLALAYQLEREANGMRFLRTEPPKNATTTGRPVSAPPVECRYFRAAGSCRNGNACTFAHVGTPGAPRAAGAPVTEGAAPLAGEASARAAEGAEALAGDASAPAVEGTEPQAEAAAAAPAAEPAAEEDTEGGWETARPLRAAAPPRAACRFFAAAGGCRNAATCRFTHEHAAPGAAGGAGAGAVTLSALRGGLQAVSLGGAGSGAAAPAAAPPSAPVPAPAPAPAPVPAPASLESHLSAVQLAEVRAAFGSEALAGRVEAVDFLEDADGEGEWITPISPAAAAARGAAAAGAAAAAAAAAAAGEAAGGGAPGRLAIAVVTSDFAMQNVALQLGLQLATAGGKALSCVKSWVLKCDACFTILNDGRLDRLFCPRCGNAALARLGVTAGADGAPRYHYRARRVVPTRGTVFSLPAPRGGRAGDILMREDQMLTGIWLQRARAAHRAADAPMFAAADATGAGGSGADARWAHTGGTPKGGAYAAAAPDIVVGLGLKNPNAVKGKRR